MAGSSFVIWVGVATAAALVGGHLPLLRGQGGGTPRRMIAFGAGLLLGAALLKMLPAAWDGSPRPELWLVGGFAGFFCLERFVMVHPCAEGSCDVHLLGRSAWAGIGLHALLEGVAVGASLHHTGLATWLLWAVVLHRCPEAYTLSRLLLAGDRSRRTVAQLAWAFALLLPVGAALGWAVFHDMPQAAARMVLAGAGAFLAVAASDLLPNIHDEHGRSRGSLLAFLAGLALMGLPFGH